MSKSLYVGNLTYDTTEDDLRKLFEEYEIVDARVIGNKGFGFVDLPDEKAADAIAALNGKDHRGRALVVNEARPRTERSGGSRGGGGFRGGGDSYGQARRRY